jgi:hypothetical protein
MIMDIKTMDMFDDPKGKTITINTSEWRAVQYVGKYHIYLSMRSFLMLN